MVEVGATGTVFGIRFASMASIRQMSRRLTARQSGDVAVATDRKTIRPS
jgi:hypothetical protein